MAVVFKIPKCISHLGIGLGCCAPSSKNDKPRDAFAAGSIECGEVGTPEGLRSPDLHLERVAS